MKGKWHKNDPEALPALTKLLEENYPSLLIYQKTGVVYLRGPIDIVKENKLLDSFTLEIELPDNYPIGIPIVRDIVRRFPWIADRHIYEDGRLCLLVPDEYWKYYTPQTTIVDFIKNLVEPFLISQIYYDKNGRMPFGERSHGWEGIAEFYSEVLGTNDQKVIFQFIKYLSAKQFKGHWQCYCGSGLRLRNCHFQRLSEMHQKIPSQVASNSLKYAPDSLRKVS